MLASRRGLEAQREVFDAFSGGTGGGDGEGEPICRTRQRAGAAEEEVAQGAEGGEVGDRRAAGPCLGGARLVGDHLQLAAEVVSEQGTAGVELVGDEATTRHVAERSPVLALAEHGFLVATAVVEEHGRRGADELVGHEDLVLVVVVARLEEVELQRALASHGSTRAYGDEATRVRLGPRLRSPADL